MNEGENILKRQQTEYRRRVPLPGFGVHPSWDKTSSADDSTGIERTRDRVLEFLAQPLLSIWTLLAIVHMLLVVGVGAWFFFIFLDSGGPNNFAMSQDDSDKHRNISIQVLTSLFTWSALLTMPWRLSNATHLTYNTGRDHFGFYHPCCNTVVGRLCCAPGPSRSCAAGHDFYGKETEAIWFNISTSHRRAIVTLLLMNTFSQFLNQAMRIVYYDYHSSNEYPGSAWCNAPFATSMVTGIIAAFYQLLQERKLRREEPERFPSGPLESFALSYRGWRRGLWTIIPRSNWHHEKVRQRALQKGAMTEGVTQAHVVLQAAEETPRTRSVIDAIARAAG